MKCLYAYKGKVRQYVSPLNIPPIPQPQEYAMLAADTLGAVAAVPRYDVRGTCCTGSLNVPGDNRSTHPREPSLSEAAIQLSRMFTDMAAFATDVGIDRTAAVTSTNQSAATDTDANADADADADVTPMEAGEIVSDNDTDDGETSPVANRTAPGGTLRIPFSPQVINRINAFAHEDAQAPLPTLRAPLKKPLRELLPPRYMNFMERGTFEENVELAHAADYLQIEPLIQLGAAWLGSALLERTPGEVERLLRLQPHFTAEDCRHAAFYSQQVLSVGASDAAKDGLRSMPQQPTE